MMFAIRVDGNSIIATGHIMRCLSLAFEMRNHDYDCLFIVADDNSRKLLSPFGFPIHVLNSIWNKLDLELPQLLLTISEKKIDFLIVDSYFATENYLEAIERVCPVLYIDDLFEIHPKISMVLNYSVYSQTLPYSSYYQDTQTKLLLGMQYAPLRSEFKNLCYSRRERVLKILITAGGVDTYNCAGKIVLTALSVPNIKHLEYHIVAGKLNSHLNDLLVISNNHPNVIIHQNVSNMVSLMLDSDIAITAGGTTTYELCACGIPSICFSWADNQLMNVKAFGDNKLMIHAGDFRENPEMCILRIIDALHCFLINGPLRRKYSEKMQNVVDGRGTERIISEILEK